MEHRIKRLQAWVIGWLLLGQLWATAGEDLPRYIFLFIGDGMGEPHVMAADQYLRESTGTVTETPLLEMLQLGGRGSLSTFSKSSLVTDSAASASAFSTGQKVPGYCLNYDTDLGIAHEPLAPYVSRLGYKMGIISSAPVNHATPAGFYAVASHRNAYQDIGHQLALSPVDYIGGEPLMEVGEEAGAILAKARANGFRIIEDREAFESLGAGGDRIWVNSPMPYRVDERHAISLADHTAKAIELLKDAPGFFIMVEGAKIDWASHSNDSITAILELLEMDAAVAVARRFLEQFPEDTLLIVTSDHETGGLVFEGSRPNGSMTDVLQAQSGSLAGMDSRFLELESARMDFDAALPRMQSWFGLSRLTEEEWQAIREAFSLGGDDGGGFAYGGDMRLGHAWVRVVGNRAGLRWTSFKHTDARVPVYVDGAQAGRFVGNSDNALMGAALRQLLRESAGAPATGFPAIVDGAGAR